MTRGWLTPAPAVLERDFVVQSAGRIGVGVMADIAPEGAGAGAATGQTLALAGGHHLVQEDAHHAGAVPLAGGEVEFAQDIDAPIEHSAALLGDHGRIVIVDDTI